MTAPRDPRPASIVLEEERKKLLRFVPKDDVDAFAGLYAEAQRMTAIAEILNNAEPTELVESYEFQRHWLDEELDIGANRDGWRSNQVVEITRTQQEERETMEKYMDPEYGGTSGPKLR